MPSDCEEKPQDFDELVDVVYDELRRIASNYLRHERPGMTLQATALVNETYVRLRDKGIQWRDSKHFVRIFARAMRRLLIDLARHRRAQGMPIRVDSSKLLEISKGEELPLEETIAIAELVDRLAERSPRAARVLELRVFAGLTFPEIGRAVGVTDRQAKRDWVYVLCWLKMHMEGGPV